MNEMQGRLPSVLVSEQLNDDALALLRSKANVTLRPDLSGHDLIGMLDDYQGVIVGGNAYLSASVITSGSRLRVIGCTVPQLDRIDVATALDYGVDVVSAPSGIAVATAEKIFLSMLMASGGMLAGKTLGLVGFGRIARQVTRRARAFKMKILVNQPRLTPELANEPDLEHTDLHDLLRQSDFVSIHVRDLPGEGDNIGAEELALLPHGASVINLTNQQFIDLPALADSLRSGHLHEAAILEDTPVSNPPPNLKWVPRPDGLAMQQAHRMLVQRFLDRLNSRNAAETLSLDIVPIQQVTPHEEFDQKRVDKLKNGLEETGMLVNPPQVTPWAGKYVILDGATRFNSLKQLGYPHIAVQVIEPSGDFRLHTWYHSISADVPVTELFDQLAAIEGVELGAFSAENWLHAFDDPHAICYFVEPDGTGTLLRTANPGNRAATMNAVVNTYNAWGEVERTLLTDVQRIAAQFPRMKAVAFFKAFQPEDVFDVAKHGELLPAGLTRFVVPGRVLRLNVPLELLKSPQTLAEKRAWLNDYIGDKLARSHVRYYQEPIVLIDS